MKCHNWKNLWCQIKQSTKNMNIKNVPFIGNILK